jgi:EAL domain-containing protein (putative c-di-GMP-specific phosphodiesterase class I)
MIAEGIERRPELDRLKRLGAVAGQGYYIARPMSLAQARGFAVPASATAPVDRITSQADGCLVS